MNKIIVGMGEALWDVLPEGKKIGGAPANFAYHVSQFGFDSRVVSAVGRDADGQEILDVFAQKKLTCEIEQVDYPTGTVRIIHLLNLTSQFLLGKNIQYFLSVSITSHCTHYTTIKTKL